MRIKIERLEFEVEPETVGDVVYILFGPEKEEGESPRAAMIQTVAGLLEQYLKYVFAQKSEPPWAEGHPFGERVVRVGLEDQLEMLRKKGWTIEPPVIDPGGAEPNDETQKEFLERVRKEAATGKHGAPAVDPDHDPEQE